MEDQEAQDPLLYQELRYYLLDLQDPLDPEVLQLRKVQEALEDLGIPSVQRILSRLVFLWSLLGRQRQDFLWVLYFLDYQGVRLAQYPRVRPIAQECLKFVNFF